MLLSGENSDKLMKVCRCLYIRGGILSGIALPGDHLIYSTSRPSTELNRFIGNSGEPLRILMKKSNDPSTILGITRCKRRNLAHS